MGKTVSTNYVIYEQQLLLYDFNTPLLSSPDLFRIHSNMQLLQQPIQFIGGYINKF